MTDALPPGEFEIGVVVARRRLKGPWADVSWSPCAVLPAAPPVAPWTLLGASEEVDTFYAGPATLSLHPGETAHYRDNLTSGRPSVWVALRKAGGDDYAVAAVTADPYEGESMAEGIGEIVEAVPMPVEIQAAVAAFFDAFHQERVFFKRKRDRADPEALARRGRVSPKDDRR